MTGSVKVSVLMLTYGHEHFIEEAINAVLNQITSFTIELVIANDNSPDNTDAIVRKKMNDCRGNVRIKYLQRKMNMGALQNFSDATKYCIGSYFAICEGDDYWTDPYKLQKQVDFLDRHPDYAATFTNVNVVLESGFYNATNEMKRIEESRPFTGEEILQDWISHTATYLIRNNGPINHFLTLNEQFSFMYGDTPLLLSALEYGKIYGFKDVTASYRRHEGGVTNQNQDDLFFLKFIEHIKKIKIAFNKKSYAKICNRTITIFYMKLFFTQRILSRHKYYYLLKAIKYDKALFLNILRDKFEAIKRGS